MENENNSDIGEEIISRLKEIILKLNFLISKNEKELLCKEIDIK